MITERVKGIQHTVKISRDIGLKFEFLNQPFTFCNRAAVKCGFIGELEGILRGDNGPSERCEDRCDATQVQGSGNRCS